MDDLQWPVPPRPVRLYTPTSAPEPEPKEPVIHPINIYENETEYGVGSKNIHYIDLEQEVGIHGYIATFPGCCGYGVWYALPYNKENISKATKVLKEILLENANGDGFGSIIATVVDERLECFQDNGWELIHEHLNPLSGNQIYTIILEP